jgi:hypothetical protein
VTPAQLTFLLDLDLWRPERPGRDLGSTSIASANGSKCWWTPVARWPHERSPPSTKLVVAGLSRLRAGVRPGIFEPAAQSDDELRDRHEAMREGDSIYADDAPMRDSSGDWLQCEVGGYIVRARREEAWDAIVVLLVALDAEHRDYFHAVMQGCRRLSNSGRRSTAWTICCRHRSSTSTTSRSHGSTGERSELRDARRRARLPRDGATAETHAIRGVDDGVDRVNPIVAAYFRAADEAPESSNETARSSERKLESASSTGPSAASHLEAMSRRWRPTSPNRSSGRGALTEAGVFPERPRALLEAETPTRGPPGSRACGR